MKMLSKSVLLFLASANLLAQPSPSQTAKARSVIWRPPKVIDIREVAPKPTVKKEIVRRLYIAGWPVTLEETDLDRAASHFGVPTGEEGDASEFAKWICLSGEGPQGVWGLWLESSEISGPKIDRFHLQLVPPGSRLDHRCKALGTGNKLLELPLLISLGMRENDVIGAWGQPSDRYRNTAQYYYQHPVRTLNKSSTLLNYVYIIYRDEKVWAIVADHSTQD